MVLFLILPLAVLSAIPFLFVASRVKHAPTPEIVEDTEKEVQEQDELDHAREIAFCDCYGYPIDQAF